MPEGLDELLWSFAPAEHVRPATPGRRARDLAGVDGAWPRTLKRRGLRFVGPTTAYALMQATGMVDDHIATCWRAG